MNRSDTRAAANQAPPYHSMEEVLSSDNFFWVGRGGNGVIKKGNADVRSIVESKATEYVERERNNRGAGFARELLGNELKTVKFVVPKDKILLDLERDEREEQANGTVRKRRLSIRRKNSLLQKHGGIENIRSYPEGVCVEVGEGWVLDVLQHKLREYAKELRGRSEDPKNRPLETEIRPVPGAVDEQSETAIFDQVMADLSNSEQDESLDDFCDRFLPGAVLPSTDPYVDDFDMDFGFDWSRIG